MCTVTEVSAGSVHVRVVDSDSGFASLASAWEELQRNAAVTSVFESFDWQYLWWTSYGRGRPLKLLVASRGDTLVGVLSLYVYTLRTLAFPVRLLRFVGSGGDTSPDDLGPIFAAGHEVEVAEALAAAVLRLPGWDVLLLSDMDPTSAFTPVIQSAARAQQLGVRSGSSERIAYLDLPATWDDWLKSLSGDRRYRIRNIRKKLSAAYPSRFFVWDDPATLDQGIDRLIYLHHKRWKSINQPHGFASPEYVGFHRAVMAACLARDRLRLYCLELAGQVVAMFYFYRFRDRVYLMQSGFDPDYGNVKPGQVLLGHIVEHAIGEGHKVLDFLRGDHRYKEEIASGERQTVYLTAFRPSHLGAWIYHFRKVFLPEAKAEFLEAKRRAHPAPAGPE